MQTAAVTPPSPRSGKINAALQEDLPVHGWYRFVLSYPPHLVRQYIASFGLDGRDLLFDPFCGTGTTLVEAKKNQIPSAGCDAHPFAAMVSRVKTNWDLNAIALRKISRAVLQEAEETAAEHGLTALSLDARLLRDEPASLNGFQLTEDEARILPTGFLSQRPLQRLLILRQRIEEKTRNADLSIREFFLVALAHVIANGAGNFAFGPEIYRTRPKPDYDVLGHFARHVDLMITELAKMQRAGVSGVRAEALSDDARTLEHAPGGISAVITSPPYPNEKDYTRTTRVESILLRIVSDRAQLRGVKESLLRSNTRNVFVDDHDGDEVAEFASVQQICHQIERRRIELEKDSGFERLYHRVVAHYFGGMRRRRPDERRARSEVNALAWTKR